MGLVRRITLDACVPSDGGRRGGKAAGAGTGRAPRLDGLEDFSLDRQIRLLRDCGDRKLPLRYPCNDLIVCTRAG